MRQTVTSATGFGAASSRVCRRVLGDRDRPADHNFATADQALAWGLESREKIAEELSKARERDQLRLQHNRQYGASYLISLARKDLCPQHIWQLCNSAANYTSPLG